MGISAVGGCAGRADDMLTVSGFIRAVLMCGEPAYRFGFSVELKTRFTKDWDIFNVRAMAAGLSPAPNDARMRFSLPSGISSFSLIFLLRDVPD